MSKRAAYNNTEPEQQHAVHTTEEGSCSGAFEARARVDSGAPAAQRTVELLFATNCFKAESAVRRARQRTHCVGEHTEPNNTETSVV